MEALETVKRMVATVRCPKCKNDFWLLDAPMYDGTAS
jgi:Zn ribbon nucleic-acid-binding protein